MAEPTDGLSEPDDHHWQLAGVAFPGGGDFKLVPAEQVIEAAQTLIKTIAQLGRNYQPGDRAAAIQVLVAVDRFLRLPGPPMYLDCYKPIFDLMTAFEDLDFGKISSLVRPRKPKGRARDPRRERVIRATAAGFVEVLMAAGASEPEALRDVANVLHGNGFPFPGTIESAKRRENTVEGWRRRVRENRTGRADVEAYQFTRSDNAPQAGEPPEHARRRAVFTLAAVLEVHGYRKKKGNKG